MFTIHGKGILPIDHFVLWIEMLCSHIKTQKMKVLTFLFDFGITEIIFKEVNHI